VSEGPALAYFSAVEGRWTCPLDFEITSWPALHESPLALFDRLRFAWMGHLPRNLARSVLHTSVEVVGPREVVHTTRVTSWGVTMLSSVETIRIDEDGRRFLLTGGQRVFPDPLTRRRVSGRGEVDPTATRARYELTWLGASLTQSTVWDASAATVTVTQETGFSRGVQVLRRAGRVLGA
jgi:hypothetical protein